MSTSIYDDDKDVDSHRNMDGSHDDLGVSGEDRQREIDELEDLWKEDSGGDSDSINTDNLSQAEDDETNREVDTRDSADEDEQNDINSRLHNAIQNINDGGEDFFNPKPTGQFSGLVGKGLSRRRSIFFATGIAGLILSFGGIFGFLNIFRLKHLMENINFQAFSRYNAAVDRRSDKWVRSYFKIRLMEFNGDVTTNSDGNAFFRANRVDTNNPITDWYRTMRASRFEADLLQTQGIRFTSVIGPDGKVRTGKIDIAGKEFSIVPDGDVSNASIDDLLSDTKKFDKLTSNIDGSLVTIFDNDKQARASIKDAVNKNTKRWQVLKRRHMRKWIANMTGTRDWRFFDKTRTKYENKRTEMQRKLVGKLFPENSRSSNFMMCILGIGGCSATTDPHNPDNQSATGSASGATQANNDAPDGVDENGNPLPAEPTDGRDIDTTTRASREAINDTIENAADEGLDISEKAANKEIISQMTKHFATAIGGATAVKKVLDWALKFQNNLKINETTGRSKIGDAIYNARLTTSLIPAYTTFSIMADQMQSGEVDPAQVDAAMDYLNGLENSEAVSYIFENKSYNGETVLQTNTKADGTQEYVNKCGTGVPFDDDDFVPFCDHYKPAGSNKTSGLEATWNKYIAGSPLGVILDSYGKVKDNFITGTFLSVFDYLGDAASKAFTPILEATGLADQLADLTSWLGDRISSFVGVRPCITGFEQVGGMAVNCITGGAAALAETATRGAGGVLAAVDSIGYQESVAMTEEYLNEQYESMSTFDRYFALNNSQSLASNMLFSFANSTSTTSGIGGILSSINVTSALNGFGSLFSGKARAAEFKDLSTFSGVDTYVIPTECIELEPISSDYWQRATNNPKISRDAETLSSSAGFSKALYAENGDNLDAQEISDIYNTYNCAAFDNVVMEGIGYTYGYEGGDGYGSSAANSTDSETSASPVGTFTAGTDVPAKSTASMPCHISPTSREGFVTDGWKNGIGPIPIKLCIVHDFAINAVMSENFDRMFSDMKAAGYSLPNANQGNFRSYSTQASMNATNPNATATAGNSNHQFGVAVDITCANSDGSKLFTPYMQGKARGLPAFQKAINEHPCLNWLAQNSQKYGLLLQCRGQGRNNGEISASTGGCETWHLSPTGK